MLYKTGLVVVAGNLWSGRQTVGDRLNALFSFNHFNVGKELERNRQASRDFDAWYGSIIDAGELLDKAVIEQIIWQLSAKADHSKLIVCTDLTDTLDECGIIKAMGIPTEQIVGFILNVDRNECLRRGREKMSQRREEYARLGRSARLSPTYVETRIRAHERHFPDVTKFMKQNCGRLHEIDGNNGPESAWQSVRAVIDWNAEHLRAECA